MDVLLSELNIWHWMILAAIMFGLEMMTGTFDLLMVAIAAAITGLFANYAPGGLSDWTWQCVCFAVASAGLVLFGRVFLSKLRNSTPEHPTLNKRMASLMGRRGVAVEAFDGTGGQIKLDDTVWRAEAAEGEIIGAGDAVVVEGANGTIAVVRKAS